MNQGMYKHNASIKYIPIAIALILILLFVLQAKSVFPDLLIFLWMVAAFSGPFIRIEIQGDTLNISSGRYKSQIRQVDLKKCKYHPVIASGRLFRVAQLELNDNPSEGRGILIPR